jgi:hypothetical protein
MEPLGRALLAFPLIPALASPSGPRLAVSVVSKPAALEAGAAWQATIRVRHNGRPLVGVRPALVIARGATRRSFPARAAGRGLYRARVVFPTAGRWTYSARVGRKSFRLGAVTVREQQVRLTTAADVVIAADGSLVVADAQGNQVVRLAGQTLSRLARLEFAIEVALDPRGGVAVVTEERRVQHISGTRVRTIAGTATSGFSGDGGPATAAQLDQPTSIAYDTAGNLFVTELGGRIRHVDAASGTITTFAGVGGQGLSGDGGSAIRAQLDRPHGLAVAADGTVYFGDTFNNRVRKVAPDGTISTVATGLSTPNDVTLGPDGALYSTDYGSNRIVRIDPARSCDDGRCGRRPEQRRGGPGSNRLRHRAHEPVGTPHRPDDRRRHPASPLAGSSGSFQRLRTAFSCSYPRTLIEPVERAKRRPSAGSRPSQRAASTRSWCPCPKTSTSACAARSSAITRSARRPTLTAVSPAGAPSLQSDQSGRSARISAVVRPSYSP